ncbi:MAG: DUF192 domain-containing protein [Candidatus Levybacteria bacterium]|nr:DUF192 domain-containing protein [Candidatus Levybacteria bacterium]
MTVFNQTKQTILANNIIEAKSFIDQSLGLLKYPTPTAMLIKTRFGIHTFFMKYAIDVLVLDKENRIVKLKENLKPNVIFIWNPKYDTVVESREGTIKKTNTQVGDVLILK